MLFVLFLDTEGAIQEPGWRCLVGESLCRCAWCVALVVVCQGIVSWRRVVFLAWAVVVAVMRARPRMVTGRVGMQHFGMFSVAFVASFASSPRIPAIPALLGCYTCILRCLVSLYHVHSKPLNACKCEKTDNRTYHSRNSRK